jgi:hypothetical protein
MLPVMQLVSYGAAPSELRFHKSHNANSAFHTIVVAQG